MELDSMGSNVFYIQNNFTHGELGRRLFSGTNLKYYYNSLSRARNVYVVPQGGVKKRHGTIYQETISALSSEYKLAPYIVTSGTEFLLVIQVGKIDFYLVYTDGSLTYDQSVTVSAITSSNINTIQFAQHSNNMLIVHEDFQPQLLTYDDGTGVFSVSSYTFKIAPAYDFEKNYYSDTFYLSNPAVGRARTLTWVGGSFTAAYEGGLFLSILGVNGGYGLARLVTVTAPTTCTVDVIYPFESGFVVANPVPGSDCFLAEPAFSATRGWPHTVTFYEDRLVLCGLNADLKQSIFLSVIGQFENFDIGDGSSDYAITSSISSQYFNEIKFLISDKTLQVFGSAASFSSVQTFDEPLSPSSASFRLQADKGCNNMQPLLMDNQTFFCREGGAVIMSFVFDPDNNSYTAVPSSLYSPQLINNPIRGAVLKGDEVEDADYMFMVNADGSLIVYQGVQTENVSAYTICVTGNDALTPEIINPNEGKYKDIVNVGNHIYVMVERIVNNVTVQYLELLTFDYFTDCSVLKEYMHPTYTISGLNHLIGQAVNVTGTNGEPLRVDKSESSNYGKVNSSGEITLLDSDTYFKVGIPFSVLVRTIPANVAGSGRLYIPKKIVRLFVDYYESLGIEVNGSPIPELIIANYKWGDAQPLRTGFYVARGDQWGARVTIDITQDQPVPFMILGLGYEVSI